MNIRFQYLDTLKGFAIFLVVMGHVISWFFDSYQNTIETIPQAMTIWRIIYSFHMPLLIFISGFLYSSQNTETRISISYWWHKVSGLLFPFIVMGLLFYIIKGRTDSYWFLRTLFFYISFQMIYDFVRMKLTSKKIVDIVWILLSILCFKLSYKCVDFYYFDLIFDFDHLSMYWIYFVLAVFCRRYNLFDKYLIPIIANVCALISIVYFICIYKMVVIPSYINYICVFSTIVALFYLFKNKLFFKSVTDCLEYLGKHSMEIYILHFYFLVQMTCIGDVILYYIDKGSLFSFLNSQTLELFISIVVAIVNVFMCIVVFEPLKVFKKVYYIMFGRKI